jgi:hypothetical protein
MALKASEVSAARFLALRAARETASAEAGDRLRRGREKVLAARLASRVESMRVESRWRHVEAHVPGAAQAWLRDVDAPAQEFVLGTAGRPVTAVAIDLGCYTPGYSRCRCHSFRGGRWRPMCHPPIVNGSSKDCDVCSDPCSSCAPGGG